MTDLPKFHVKNPTNREEKLIVKMIEDLNATTSHFIHTNFKGNITHEQFVVLRDASIGYAGAMVRDLGKLLSDKNQIMPFLNMGKELFNIYIDNLQKELL